MNEKQYPSFVVALAGNPNTGKSTVFNALTGLKQHTGNWPGKTVVHAKGRYRYKGQDFVLVDLPGTYSLLANSPEEQVARNFICFGPLAAAVVVVDATCLERNLNLVLQVTEITHRVIVCLNLMDEARRRNLVLDIPTLERELGVPVIPTTARSRQGLAELKEAIYLVATGRVIPQPVRLQYEPLLEAQIAAILPNLESLPPKYNKRWIALRLMAGDNSIFDEAGVEI